MTPVVEIPLWLALPYWLLRGFIWVACAIIAVLVGALVLIGWAGYKVGERIEDFRLARGSEATTEVRR